MQEKLNIATEIQELLRQHVQSALTIDPRENTQRILRIKELFVQLQAGHFLNSVAQTQSHFSYWGQLVIPY